MKRTSIILAALLCLSLTAPVPLPAQVPGAPGQLIKRLVFFNFERERVADVVVFSLPAPPDHVNWRTFYIQHDGLLVQLDYATAPEGSNTPRFTSDLKAWQGPTPPPADPDGFLASASPISHWSMVIHQISGGAGESQAGEPNDDGDDEEEADSGGTSTTIRFIVTDFLANRGDDDDGEEGPVTLAFTISEIPHVNSELDQFFADKLPLLTQVLGVQNHIRASGGWDHLAKALDFILSTELFTVLDPGVAPPLQGTGTGGGFLLQPGPGCDPNDINTLCARCDDVWKLCQGFVNKEPADTIVNCISAAVDCEGVKGRRVEICKPEPQPCEFGCTPGQPCVEGCGQPPGPCEFGCPPLLPCVEGCGK